jgi:hypothetical protein
MKKTMLLIGVAALVSAGCAHHHRDYVRHHGRYYVTEEHPGEVMVIERDGTRTYVREYDRLDYQNNMEPRTRGKHADSLGWNTENYYLQRGY